MCSYLTEQSNSQFRRSWTHKYTLRSHLDGVRCVQFHPVEPLLVSASEDKVVKVEIERRISDNDDDL